MIVLTSKVEVEGVTGVQVTDFLLHADDEAYRRWWPGTHLRFRTVRRVPGDVGNVVYMDEYVGERRLRMHAIVLEAVCGKRLVWQMKKGVKLPVWLSLTVEQGDRGVLLTHRLVAGNDGRLGRLLDPLLRLYLSDQFARWMDTHAREEFPRLGELLRTP